MVQKGNCTLPKRFFVLIFFTVFSDCDCETVNVISNRGIEGIYQKLAWDVNGRTSWNSSNGKAVWFHQTYVGWFFGPMESLGGASVNLISFPGNHSCLYNIPGDQWLYYDSGASAWTYVNVGDVIIQCLSGNFNSQFFEIKF